MNEDVKMILDLAEDSMKDSLEHLAQGLTKIRAGRATPGMLSTVQLDYYGTMTPLNQVSNINTPDARTITVQPWEKAMMEPIEKAIRDANLGFNPQNNGEKVIINVPPLTEERRKDLVKQARAVGEDAKVSIRNSRKDANDEIKKLQKDGLSEDMCKNAETDVQALTDKYTEKVDSLVDVKEKDIMTV